MNTTKQEYFKMTKDEFATLLNGREYGDEVTSELEAQAADYGLVVVYGASDDLMEFRGCISDEVGSWDGTTVCINSKGRILEEDTVEIYNEEKMHFTRIDAIWCPKHHGVNKPYASWLIDAEQIDTAAFDIMEDGELFCRGIVFEFAQLSKRPDQS